MVACLLASALHFFYIFKKLFATNEEKTVEIFTVIDLRVERMQKWTGVFQRLCVFETSLCGQPSGRMSSLNEHAVVGLPCLL